MTDDEAATLLGIAYDALLMTPEGRRTFLICRAMGDILHEISILRHRTPEDIQNEFEGKAGPSNEP